MDAILQELVTPKFLALYGYLACVCFVHFRGKERLRFERQLTEHSGIFSPYNIWWYLFSAVPKDPYLDVSLFPQLAPLRANWKTIRDEAVALHSAGLIDYKDEHTDLTFLSFKKRGWKRFHLKWYDAFLPSALEHCPETVRLVQSIPDINAAAFTMLPPGKKLGRHRDPFAGSLRYHLGLVTPKSDGCSIWVDGQRYSWRDGEDVVFDETYIHWAENATEENRIIFFADVTRPLKTRPMRAISRFMNQHVFKITGSHNRPDEAAGALNRFTPVIFRLKYFFIGLKKKNRRVYYASKYALVAGAVGILIACSVLP